MNYKKKHNSLLLITLLFSYDGIVFQDHAHSNYGHHYTSLANTEGIPLTTGGYSNYTSSDYTNKAETYDYSTNTWTEVAEYPYHEK